MAEPEPPGTGSGEDRPAGFEEAEFMAALTGWAAGQKVSGAAAARSRLRALTDAASGSATLTGILVDLAERDAPVTLTVGPAPDGGAARMSGRLVGVGRDFCVLDRPGRGPVVIRSDALTAVMEDGPGRAGDRGAPLSLSFHAVLSELAGERTPVALTTGADRLEGELAAVGEDVVVLQSGRSPRRFVHVRLQAVQACELR